MQELCECHGHIFMDGADYRTAKERHSHGPSEAAICENLRKLSCVGVTYYRDGGDDLGVSLRAKSLAADFGMEFVTPAFAIHRRGRYGSIVGKCYETLSDFRSLVETVRAAGGDFIKIMFSGIMRFDEQRPLSCPSLEEEEIISLVSAAHDAGMPVMAHVNGADAVLAAVKAGTDSIEHGYYTDDACLEAMAASGCIWVPTLAAVEAFVNREGIDTAVVQKVLQHQLRQVGKAVSLGIPVASGSDAGAVGVAHGGGILRELHLLESAGIDQKQICCANAHLRARFARN